MIELEQLIDTHPLVKESAVIGDIPGNDAPKAYCVLHSSGSSVLSELLAESKKAGSDDEMRSLIEWLENNEKKKIARHVYDFVAKRTPESNHLKGGVCLMEGELQGIVELKKIDRKKLQNITQNDLI